MISIQHKIKERRLFTMDPIGLFVFGIIAILLLSAIIIPQIQRVSNDLAETNSDNE